MMRIMVQWCNCTERTKPGIERTKFTTTSKAVVWNHYVITELPYLPVQWGSYSAPITSLYDIRNSIIKIPDQTKDAELGMLSWKCNQLIVSFQGTEKRLSALASIQNIDSSFPPKNESSTMVTNSYLRLKYLHLCSKEKLFLESAI